MCYIDLRSYLQGLNGIGPARCQKRPITCQKRPINVCYIDLRSYLQGLNDIGPAPRDLGIILVVSKSKVSKEAYYVSKETY